MKGYGRDCNSGEGLVFRGKGDMSSLEYSDQKMGGVDLAIQQEVIMVSRTNQDEWMYQELRLARKLIGIETAC